MPNIKPISDLRHYDTVVNEVSYGSPVFLTKNGHGQMVLISMQEYDEMQKKLALYSLNHEMEKAEMSIEKEGTLTHEELKEALRV